MSGNKLVLDTNVIIYYLRGVNNSFDFIKKHVNDQINISIISKIELLSYHDTTDEDETLINGFIKKLTVVSISTEIEQNTIEFRRKTRLKLPDSIIAATALSIDATLVTCDEKLTKTNYPKLRTIML